MEFFGVIEKNDPILEVGEGNDWESIICDKNNWHQRAGKRITPLFVKQPSHNISDFSWTILSDIVITEKTLNILKSANLTGFRVNKIVFEIGEKNNKNYDSFWEFVVIGKGGLSHPGSGIILNYECEICGFKEFSSFKNGLQVDENRWDGSDFFYLDEYPKDILCTKKAKAIIEQNDFSNIDFIISSEIKWPNDVLLK